MKIVKVGLETIEVAKKIPERASLLFLQKKKDINTRRSEIVFTCPIPKVNFVGKESSAKEEARRNGQTFTFLKTIFKEIYTLPNNEKNETRENNI